MSKRNISHILVAFLLLWSATPTSASSNSETLSTGELRTIVEPIALYPDVLLSSVLPAATFPDQIVDAALLIKTKEDAKQIKDQSWDPSVKTIATYPGILKMMFEKLDWTTQLGTAFLNQHDDLVAAIQNLRVQAKESGALVSNSAQKVATSTTASGQTIVQIQPTDPQVVYVPTTTTVVEDNSAESTLVPLATFGLGMAMGSMMADDDDDDVNVYYGGYGGAWYDDDHFDNWVDHRRAIWEDHNDRSWDRQDYRQDARDDHRNFRQDSIESGTWNPPSAEQRAAAKQNVQSRQATRQQSGSSRSAAQSSTAAQQRASRQQSASNSAAAQQRAARQQTNLANSSAARQRADAARSQAQSRGWSGSSGSWGSQSGAFSGYGSRASTMQASNRGMSSRSYGGGGGRASFGGGGGRRGGGRR